MSDGYKNTNWKWVESGDVLDIRDGTHDSPSRSDTGFPLITSKNLVSGRIAFDDAYFISKKDHEAIKKRSGVQKGDILMPMIGTIGNPVLVETDHEFSIKNVALFRRDGSSYDERFLLHLLRSQLITAQLNVSKRGGTQKFVSLGMLRSLKLPLPPIAEQRRIATILDKADAIRRKRRQAIDLMNDFLRSVFLEMFGDKAKGRKEWQEVKLKDLLTFLTSGSRGWAKYYVPVGDTFLRIQNVGNNKLMIDDVAFVNAPVGAEAERTRVKAGDILLSITADLGRTAVIPKGLGTAYINQHLSILRIQGAEPIYVSAFLASEEGQRQIRRLDRVGVKSGLNFDDIRSLKILLPPHELQTSYIRIYRKVCDMESSLAASDSEIDAMRNALTYQLFHSQVT